MIEDAWNTGPVPPEIVLDASVAERRIDPDGIPEPRRPPDAHEPAPSIRILCARIPIESCTPGDAVDRVLGLSSPTRTRGADVHLCNAFTLALADGDAEYRELLRHATLNLADGKSVAWVNQIYAAPPTGSDRIRGTDLVLAVVDRGRTLGLRHYLLGGTEEVVHALDERLRLAYPGVRIVGVESPPFRELSVEEALEQMERIERSGADVVWVGLGTPKQDLAAAAIGSSTRAVAVAVGAAFDFIAGTKPSAPRWMQESGLEWVHRFSSEPRRLWRRYLLGNARFVYAAHRHRPHRERAAR